MGTVAGILVVVAMAAIVVSLLIETWAGVRTQRVPAPVQVQVEDWERPRPR
jgi:hypothetical protein